MWEFKRIFRKTRARAKILGPTPGANGDSDPLLPGELPESDFPDDAEHWIIVYSELVQTASSLVKAEFAGRYQPGGIPEYWRDGVR